MLPGMQRRHHYERAFEAYLRARRMPYVAVDEARKALLPDGHAAWAPPADDQAAALKSFDFVVYGQGGNLLLDIKGRRVRTAASRRGQVNLESSGRLESWVTEDDVASLRHWEALFGSGFEAAFVFVYWCAAQPPDALFQEIFEHGGEWYALRCVRLRDYAASMKPRSRRWRTVDLPSAVFRRVSQPFAPSPNRPGPIGGLWPSGDGSPVSDVGPVEPMLEPLGRG
jgi:hypothetical protein